MPDKSVILELETTYWDTMVAGEHDKSAELLADRAVIGAMGARSFAKEDYAPFAEKSGWTIKSYSMSDEEVTFPTENVAVITYKVSQQSVHDGRRDDLEAWDSTVWVREDDVWKAVLHTESPIG